MNKAKPAIYWAIAGAVFTILVMQIDTWAIPIIEGAGWGFAYLLALKSVMHAYDRVEEYDEADEIRSYDFQTIDYERMVFVVAGNSMYRMPENLVEKARRVAFHVKYMNGKIVYRYLYRLGFTETAVKAFHDALIDIGMIERSSPTYEKSKFVFTSDWPKLRDSLAREYVESRSPTPEEWHAYVAYNRRNVDRHDSADTNSLVGEGL